MTPFDLDVFAAPLEVPELRSASVVLRPFTMADLALVRQAAEDPYIPTITSLPATYSEAEGQAFIARQLERALGGHGYPFVIAEAADPVVGVGSVGLWLREIESGRASIGYWLVPAARGKKLAEAAVRLLSDFAFDVLAIPRLHLFVEPWNSASLRTAERAGFHREGILRGWERIDDVQRDAICFALLREEWDGPSHNGHHE
jgi:ribosomal-protein-alanine N-acetyltransferase